MAAYGSLCTEFYDLDKPTAPTAALHFYIEQARASGGRVLEPMCGSGRFLIPMAQAGIAVDGFDSSFAMLQVCCTRSQRMGVEVQLFQQDFASMHMPHSYAMAFAPSGSMCLVTDEAELRKGISLLRAHMQLGGRLLVELAPDDDAIDGPVHFAPRVVQCSDGSSITYRCTASRLPVRHTLCFTGTYERHSTGHLVATESEQLLLRPYDAENFAAILTECGFRFTRQWKATDLDFLTEGGCTLLEARADA